MEESHGEGVKTTMKATIDIKYVEVHYTTSEDRIVHVFKIWQSKNVPAYLDDALMLYIWDYYEGKRYEEWLKLC